MYADLMRLVIGILLGISLSSNLSNIVPFNGYRHHNHLSRLNQRGLRVRTYFDPPSIDKILRHALDYNVEEESGILHESVPQ